MGTVAAEQFRVDVVKRRIYFHRRSFAMQYNAIQYNTISGILCNNGLLYSNCMYRSVDIIHRRLAKQ